LAIVTPSFHMIFHGSMLEVVPLLTNGSLP
jgi:hypothetical protein